MVRQAAAMSRRHVAVRGYVARVICRWIEREGAVT
jgi:hypothetical protein